MPAAYTHTYISHLILERLASGADEQNGKVRVSLPPTLHGPASVTIPSQTVNLLLQKPASFCLGSASPDFFADVVTGITTSHQPKNEGRTLSHFMSTLSSSVNWGNPNQVAWLLGWFSHLCADVFGHHWVGKEAGGKFETWLDTDPQIIRKHLGIEMVWAEKAKTDAGASRDFLQTYIVKEFDRPIPLSPDVDKTDLAFLFQRQLILDSMFTKGAPLCDAYYDRGSITTQIVKPLIKVRSWRDWHNKQIDKIKKLRKKNNSPLGRVFDLKLPRLSEDKLKKLNMDCPLCRAHGITTSIVEAACPTCAGTGIVERIVLKTCPFCDNEHQARVSCSACEGLPDAMRDVCPVCHGERELDLPCPFCATTKGAAGFIRGECQHCKGAKTVRNDLDEDCPLCKGQKALAKVLGDPEFSSRDLINLICDRLIIYHENRRKRIDLLLDTYQEAHERLTLLMIKSNAPGAKAVMDCFTSFFDQAKGFIISQLTFSDIVPELAIYEETIRKSIDKIFSMFIELVPDGWLEIVEKLRNEVIKEVLGKISELIGNPLLKKSEEQAVMSVLSQHSLSSLMLRRRPKEKIMRRPAAIPASVKPQPLNRTVPPMLFAPAADAVTLFLLSIQGCKPVKGDITKAFSKLYIADNIDNTGQPVLVFFYDQDPKFDWDARFRLVGKKNPGEENQLHIDI